MIQPQPANNPVDKNTNPSLDLQRGVLLQSQLDLGVPKLPPAVIELASITPAIDPRSYQGWEPLGTRAPVVPGTLLQIAPGTDPASEYAQRASVMHNQWRVFTAHESQLIPVDALSARIQQNIASNADSFAKVKEQIDYDLQLRRSIASRLGQPEPGYTTDELRQTNVNTVKDTFFKKALERVADIQSNSNLSSEQKQGLLRVVALATHAVANPDSAYAPVLVPGKDGKTMIVGSLDALQLVLGPGNRASLEASGFRFSDNDGKPLPPGQPIRHVILELPAFQGDNTRNGTLDRGSGDRYDGGMALVYEMTKNVNDPALMQQRIPRSSPEPVSAEQLTRVAERSNLLLGQATQNLGINPGQIDPILAGQMSLARQSVGMSPRDIQLDQENYVRATLANYYRQHPQDLIAATNDPAKKEYLDRQIGLIYSAYSDGTVRFPQSQEMRHTVKELQAAEGANLSPTSDLATRERVLRGQGAIGENLFDPWSAR
jgi:hypothetical protein